MIGRIIELPKIIDQRGNLTFAEEQRLVPFGVKRVYWTYDIPSGESRGGHAHRQCEEFIIAVSGSFKRLGGFRDTSKNKPEPKLCVSPFVFCSGAEYL